MGLIRAIAGQLRGKIQALCVVIVMLLLQTAQTEAQEKDAGVVAAERRFGFVFPDMVTRDPGIARSLGELDREPCDKTAIAALGKSLERVGYRREAAKAHVKFSESCNGHPQSLRTAVNLLMNLSDYPAAGKVATELIRLEPDQDNGYYLRGVSYSETGDTLKAIEDFTTAIELFGDKSKISSIGYTKLSKAYETLGRTCDAIVPIEAWVAINPLRNDTSQTRTLIAGLVSRGNCKPASKSEIALAATKRGNVMLVKATIDGVPGVFMVDTGASYVSLKQSFAAKAKIVTEAGSTIKLHTANGVTEGMLGRAKTVKLETLTVADVPVVVQPDAKGTYGPDVDGLLGMSLLGRFQVTIEGQTVRLKSRTGR